jgi:hypothetical protein
MTFYLKRITVCKCSVPPKRNKLKNLREKTKRAESGSVSQRYQSEDPDPLAKYTNPRIRIRTKMSWIRNTAKTVLGSNVAPCKIKLRIFNLRVLYICNGQYGNAFTLYQKLEFLKPRKETWIPNIHVSWN